MDDDHCDVASGQSPLLHLHHRLGERVPIAPPVRELEEQMIGDAQMRAAPVVVDADKQDAWHSVVR